MTSDREPQAPDGGLPASLQARYGAPAPAGRKRRTIILLVVLGLLATAAYVGVSWWWTTDDVHAEELSIRTIDDSHRELVFAVHLPEGRSATCQVEALNDMFGQVGVVDVTAGPPTDGEPVIVSAVVATSEPATAVRLAGCRYLDDS